MTNPNKAYIAFLLLVSAELAASEVDFSRDIRPILADACYTCHGPDSEQRVTDFRLDSEQGAKVEVDGGSAIQSGDSAGSVIIQRIESADPDYQMPPPDAKIRLSDKQKQLLRRWIDEGARWQGHWAFQTPQWPLAPTVSDAPWCESPIDQFVLAKIESAGLQPSPRASRRVQLRRLYLDLTGVPPTPEEMRRFLADRRPDAWQRTVDRLLQSPRFGERMATAWLDAARYADTSGYQNDGPRSMWRWRDWVIDALNGGMPFDEFTIQQLAGDLLPRASLSQRIATGFNRNHRGNAEGGIIPEEYQVEYVVDRVDTTSTVWLGLTMGCARCHDHKYDPLSQKDFYQLFAYFNNIPENGRAIKEGNSPPYIKAPTDEDSLVLQAMDSDLERLRRKHRRQLPALARAQQKWEAAETQFDSSWTLRDGLILRESFDDDLNQDSESKDTAAIGIIESPSGPAAQLTGQAIDRGDQANFGYFDKFSIAVRISPSQPTGTIVSRMVPEQHASGYYLHLQDGHLQVNLVKRWLDDSIRVSTARLISRNRWQHLTVTYDGSRKASGIAIYVDGEPVEIKVDYDWINQSFAVADQPLRIGGGQRGFVGAIDDVQIYDRRLSPQEARILATGQSIAEIVQTPEAARSVGANAKLRAYYLQRHAPEPIQTTWRQLVHASRQRRAYFEKVPTVMVMQEMESPRPTHLLKRGRYDAPAERLLPGTPSALSNLVKPDRNDRLGLARWLVHPDHPLVSRVIVNRVWQHYFGRGIVATTEDFGAQGSPPTHPMLLDFLARKLSEGWDLKNIHRLIVTSATYRQSSAISPQQAKQDPENLLWSRAPRLRLPAEMIRDQALAVSGLLVEQIGGPSVRPYQPKGLWQEIASTTDYNQSTGKSLYRRSLYTYWKRTVAPPTMITLDATSREACVVRRSRTNTPLQALALMNDPTFVECARGLATRCLKSQPRRDDSSSNESFGGETEKSQIDAWRIGQLYRLAIGRDPAATESELLKAALLRYREYFQEGEKSAALLQIGDSIPDQSLPRRELAAWTVLASMVLNLDEFVNRE